MRYRVAEREIRFVYRDAELLSGAKREEAVSVATRPILQPIIRNSHAPRHTNRGWSHVVFTVRRLFAHLCVNPKEL